MLDFLRKYFQQEGAQGGKTSGEENEKELLENNSEVVDKTNTEDKTVISEGKTDEIKSGNDLSFDELENNERILRERISGKTTSEKQEIKQEEKKTADDKTKSDENVLFDPTKSDKTSADDKTNAPIKLTKEYIASQPKEHQEFLNTMLGETVSSKVLKSWLHSQLHIAELKSGANIKQPEPTKTESSNKPAVFTEDEIKAERKHYLLQRMRTQYPDLSEDVFEDDESLEEYVADMKLHSPVKAERFLKQYLDQEGNWSKDLNSYKSLADNWETNAKANVVSAIQEFDKSLQSDYGLNSNDLGIKYTEKFIMDTFIMPGGKVDRKIVSYLDKAETIPIVNAEALQAKMEKHYKAEAVNLIRNKAADDAITGKRQRESVGLSSGGSKERQVIEKPTNTLINENMSLEAMDEALEKQKKSILNKQS